jgi:hypothetical protein
MASAMEGALRAIIDLILDHVDYTSGACRANEMVGAVLPEVIIKHARDVLALSREQDRGHAH